MALITWTMLWFCSQWSTAYMRKPLLGGTHEWHQMTLSCMQMGMMGPPPGMQVHHGRGGMHVPHHVQQRRNWECVNTCCHGQSLDIYMSWYTCVCVCKRESTADMTTHIYIHIHIHLYTYLYIHMTRVWRILTVCACALLNNRIFVQITLLSRVHWHVYMSIYGCRQTHVLIFRKERGAERSSAEQGLFMCNTLGFFAGD